MNAFLPVVDRALDRYLARRKTEPDGLPAARLATLAGVSREFMSTALQMYRREQSRHGTRYTIACEGYGTGAKWFITSRPGMDSAGLEARRASHTRYIARDALRRLLRDRGCEVRPSLRGTPQDDWLEIASQSIAGHMEVAVQAAEQMIEAVGSTAA